MYKRTIFIFYVFLVAMTTLSLCLDQKPEMEPFRKDAQQALEPSRQRRWLHRRCLSGRGFCRAICSIFEEPVRGNIDCYFGYNCCRRMFSHYRTS
uniref:Big defensin n=1 Tax=Ruditapes philippinarum TaxID=129788 RepID=E5FIA2_RUDPH|nr:big defensin [Ruditapes philippinarum]